MLEVQAHQQLKHLLRGASGHWEHQLTLSRLVGRSLRRHDRTKIHLSAGSSDRWWLALLVPLSLQSRHTVLVLDTTQHNACCMSNDHDCWRAVSGWDAGRAANHPRGISSGC